MEVKCEADFPGEYPFRDVNFVNVLEVIACQAIIEKSTGSQIKKLSIFLLLLRIIVRQPIGRLAHTPRPPTIGAHTFVQLYPDNGA